MQKINLSVCDICDIVVDYCMVLNKEDNMKNSSNEFLGKVLNRLKYEEKFSKIKIDESLYSIPKYNNNLNELKKLIRESTIYELIVIIRVLNKYLSNKYEIILTSKDFDVSKNNLFELMDDNEIEKEYIEEAIRHYEKREFRACVALTGQSLECLLRKLFDSKSNLSELIKKLKIKNSEINILSEDEIKILDEIREDRNIASHGNVEYYSFNEEDTKKYLCYIMDIYGKIIVNFQ